MDALVQELSRRRVFRAAGTYAMFAWVAVQIAGTLVPALRLPGWALPMVVYLLALGFPLVLLLAWMFDVGTDGIRTTPDPPKSKALGRRALVLVLLGLGATLALFLALRMTSGMFGSSVATAAPAGDGGEVAARSIAVLRFTDLSPGGDQRWFADGISEDVLNGLAETGELRVAARSSSFRFDPAAADVKALGAELGVATVLQGSVRRVGNQVRITAQLIDARTGFQVWSHAYDARLDDILVLQGELATSLVGDLRGAFGLGPAPSRARVEAAVDAAGG